MPEPARLVPTHPARPRLGVWLAALAGATAVLIGPGTLYGTPAAAEETLRFRVYLDREPIGEHSFRISPSRAGQQILSRASFDIDILIFNAYRYRHESREQWNDGCLQSIRSSTDDNGKSYRVEGQRVADGLALEVNGDPERLSGCISTFAYWDPRLLDQPRLLNPQTGELVAASLDSAGSERRVVQGREVSARRYRLRADRQELSLWYSEDEGWIGLESDVGRGRILRYERI